MLALIVLSARPVSATFEGIMDLADGSMAAAGRDMPLCGCGGCDTHGRFCLS